MTEHRSKPRWADADGNVWYLSQLDQTPRPWADWPPVRATVNGKPVHKVLQWETGRGSRARNFDIAVKKAAELSPEDCWPGDEIAFRKALRRLHRMNAQTNRTTTRWPDHRDRAFELWAVQCLSTRDIAEMTAPDGVDPHSWRVNLMVMLRRFRPLYEQALQEVRNAK